LLVSSASGSNGIAFERLQPQFEPKLYRTYGAPDCFFA
jgi:hypothetical protein